MGKACSTSSTGTVSNTSANFALNDTSYTTFKRQGMAQLNAVYITRQMINITSYLQDNIAEGNVTFVLQTSVFKIYLNFFGCLFSGVDGRNLKNV